MTSAMDDLFGPPISTVPTDGDGWLFTLDDWPLLYLDRNSAAINDLRASLAFAHRVWFERARAGELRPRVISGATPREALVVVGGEVVASVSCHPERPTHADVRILNPSTGTTLFDSEVRYRQLPPNPTLSSGSRGLGR